MSRLPICHLKRRAFVFTAYPFLTFYRQSCWSWFNILEVVSQKLHLLRVEDETDTVVKKSISRHKKNLYQRRKSNRKWILRTSLYSFYNYFLHAATNLFARHTLLCWCIPMPVYYPSLLLQWCLVPNDNAATNFMLNVRNVNLSVVLREPLLWIALLYCRQRGLKSRNRLHVPVRRPLNEWLL